MNMQHHVATGSNYRNIPLEHSQPQVAPSPQNTPEPQPKAVTVKDLRRYLEIRQGTLQVEVQRILHLNLAKRKEPKRRLQNEVHCKPVELGASKGITHST